MVLPMSSFLMTRSAMSGQTQVSNKPLLTTLPNMPYLTPVSRILAQDYRLMWHRLKRTPEMISVINILITDILGERVQWLDTDGCALPLSKERKAKKWWRDNMGKDVLSSMLFDAFLTGEGYLWKGQPDETEVKEAVKKAIGNLGLGLNKLQVKELYSKAIQDEAVKKTKKLDYVASSTVHIIHDQVEIYGYEQVVNTMIARFKPEEIIHYRYMSINGEVNGFSPAKALLMEILLLTAIKENMMAWMNNGGAPDKVFVLPKELANSPNHQYLIETLRKYKRVQNRHGNLVFTGEIDIQDLQGNPKDMEFKELALYITSNFAFAWQIPVSRIPYLIGSAASKGDSGGLGEAGYWNKISSIQDTLEDLLNSQLFEPMGYNIKFNRKYKQDEIRDAQRDMMRADAIVKYQEIFSKLKKQPNQKKVLEILGWNEEDLEEFEEPVVAGNYNQNTLPNGEMNNEPDKNSRNTAKSSANKRNDTNEALYKP
jgi:HK97 family phage portal protein